MAVDISTLPPPPEETEQSVSIAGLPPPPGVPAAEVGEALPPPAPELARYYEIKKETDKYGIGDLVAPSAVQARGGVFGSRSVPKSDVAAIAAGNQLDDEKSKLLQTLAPLYLASPPPEEMTTQEWALTALGRLGYAAADIPQFLAKKAFFDDPSFRNALDDLRELGEGRMGAAEWAAWNIGPAVLTAGGTTAAKAAIQAVPKTLPEIAAKGAAFGAVQGLAGSREEQEVAGLATGAALGGAVGVGGATLGKMWHKLVGKEKGPVPDAPRTEAETDALEYAKNNEADITAATNVAYEKVKDSEAAIEDIALRGKDLDEASIKKILDEQLSPETVEVARSEGKSDFDIAEQYVNSRKKDFAETIAAENPSLTKELTTDGAGLKPAKIDTIIESASERLGPEYIAERWKGQSWENLAKTQVDQQGLRVRGDEAPGIKIVANAVGDRQFGVKVIDERTGADVLPDFLNLNSNLNRLTFAKSDFYSGNAAKNITGIKNIYSVARKAGVIKDLLDVEGGTIYRAITSGTVDQLPEAEQRIARMISEYQDSVRNYANSVTGDNVSRLGIPKREDFGVSQLVVRPIEYVTKMSSKLKEITDSGIDVTKLSSDELGKLVQSNPAVADFVRGVQIVSDLKPTATGRDLLLAYKDITSRGASNPKLYAVTSTALPRRESIPDFLREKNLLRVLDRYTNNTLKSVYTREPLARLRSKANILERMGAKTEAEYVRRIIADTMGIRAASMARVGNMARMALAASLDAGLSKVVKNPALKDTLVRAAASLSELAANVQYNIYPNVLGTSPRALISQLTQTLFKTAPELGGTYGYQSALKAYMTNVLGLSSSRRPEIVARMRSYGLEPRSYTRENVDQIADAIQGSALYRVPAEAIRNGSEAIMKVYQSLDTLNRASMVDMAERLVKDVAAKDKAAFAVVEKMPLSIKRSLIKNKGNPEAQTKVLAQYLNSATQFNYNKVSMSELGAIVGPFFSTFTKWPLATAGDIAADFRTKGLSAGALRALEKYGTVWLMTQAADSLLYAAMTGDWEFSPDFKEAGPRAQKLIGRGGFASMAPIESIRPLIPGLEDKSLITPPMLDTIFKGVIKPAIEGDDEKLKAGATRALTTFAPGGYIYNILMDTAPKVLTNEPEW